MNRLLKNSLGIVAFLALLPIALKTLSVSAVWDQGRVTSFQKWREAEEHKKEVTKLNCTEKERKAQAREKGQVRAYSHHELFLPPEEIIEVGDDGYWVVESEKDCLIRRWNEVN